MKSRPNISLSLQSSVNIAAGLQSNLDRGHGESHENDQLSNLEPDD